MRVNFFIYPLFSQMDIGLYYKVCNLFFPLTHEILFSTYTLPLNTITQYSMRPIDCTTRLTWAFIPLRYCSTSVQEQLNIKAVTGTCKLIDGCSLELCSATPTVASSDICHSNKSQLNCMTLSRAQSRNIVTIHYIIVTIYWKTSFSSTLNQGRTFTPG